MHEILQVHVYIPCKCLHQIIVAAEASRRIHILSVARLAEICDFLDLFLFRLCVIDTWILVERAETKFI